MRVLVVEHTAAMRNFLGFALGVFRYIEVDHSASGADALAKIAANDYDLVVSETALPKMDGLQLLEKIKAKKKALPVILIGRNLAESTEAEAMDKGAVCVLQRPVQAHEIRNAACGAVGQSISTSSKNADRRRSPRLQMSVIMEFTIDDLVRTYSSWDISPYGAFLISDEPMDIGLRVCGTLKLPHVDEAFPIDCKVVHVRSEAFGSMPRGFGVNFEHTAESRERLSLAFSSPEE